ncbi:DEAD/DEAH box helicase [Nitratireductor aquibiodomus RA22]|uniref:DEAD/DEAH box helicase n=2 Tax=Nitratireductor aquibiodomus TaxID=204799 RepID=I5BPY1_9HYPH|nr:DEAD/DEAH box helicase [Nitratireductor aquibiodomus RA22]
MAADPARRPIIVFCMKVDDTFGLAKEAAAVRPAGGDVTIPPGIDIDRNLVDIISKGVAYHNAELSEAERLFVEQKLADGAIDIVFATSTLAAGVNFPLGGAVFAGWKRWNFERRLHEAIPRAEFQNMAGRVGRMGQQGEQGHVLLSASSAEDLHTAKKLMDAADQEALGSGITPEQFGPLVLQILAGKLCNNRGQVFEFLASTLSASREINRNLSGVDHWRPHVDQQIDRLIAQGCVIEAVESITVTALGEAVARSGLKPETAIYFINGLAQKSPALAKLLPDPTDRSLNENDMAFVLAHASLASPEFTNAGGPATRRIPWRVPAPNLVTNPYAQRLDKILLFQPWMGNHGAANGALLLAEWAAGANRQAIEELVGGVRMGSVEAMARDVAWVLTGVAEIIFTVTAPALADEARPVALVDPTTRSSVRRLARTIRRQAARINAGLPGDILWATSLDLLERPRRLPRNHILSLRSAGLIRPIDIMNGLPDVDSKRRSALDAIKNPALANRVRDAAKRWKIEDRNYAKSIHQRRAAAIGGSEVINALYASRNHAFETAFEALLGYLAIPFQHLDGRGKIGHPDFLVTIEKFPSLVVELKSKQADHDMVNFNDATDVLRASEIIGMREHPCVTLCNPGVEPSVPGLVERCGRLCVVEVSDLAEAAMRLQEGTLSRAEFYNWLTTPGIALREDLPHGR